VASALLVVHWLGDSLDGTLARVRRIERPKYGYYLDHLVDAGATIAIGVGLGLSPYMTLVTGLAIVIAYLALSINTYLETQVFGVFSLGYGRFGPTWSGITRALRRVRQPVEHARLVACEQEGLLPGCVVIHGRLLVDRRLTSDTPAAGAGYGAGSTTAGRRSARNIR
jgi:hypothetical protein